MAIQAQQLNQVIDNISQAGKGILAADESNPTIAKRFKSIQVESSEENRRAYRELLLTTPNLNEYISGVILFEETLSQSCLDGTRFVNLLNDIGIVPGIKVDKGLVSLASSENEKMTQGLDGLPERLANYKSLGAQFAKWRAIFNISPTPCSERLALINAHNLGLYAAICQSLEIVPIVEPEILIDGDHDIETCAMVTQRVLHEVFEFLDLHEVSLEHIILKPSMVLPGSDSPKASCVEIAEYTLQVFRRTVPAAVPTINFLSGGQTPDEATENLNALNQTHNPWNMSFSYGRALQEPCLKAWAGKSENVEAAQQALLNRAHLNSQACLGVYEG